MDKQTKKEFQSLARIVKKGFDETASKKDLQKLEIKASNIEIDLKETKKDIKRIDKRTDETYKLLDGYVKSQEDFRDEFIILKTEVAQIKEVIKQKLGVEIRAV